MEGIALRRVALGSQCKTPTNQMKQTTTNIQGEMRREVGAHRAQQQENTTGAREGSLRRGGANMGKKL